MSGIRVQKKYSERVRRHLLKLLAVLFSFSLWFYVLNSEALELQIKLPLVLIPPQGQALKELPPSEVLVKLKGPRAFVRNIFNQGEKVFIDLGRRGKKIKNGLEVKVLASDIPHPLGVEVTEIQPSLIKLNLESKRSKTVKLKPFLVGKVPSQLELIQYELIPEELRISGPRSLLKGLDSLETSPIELDKLEGEGRVKILLKELDPRLSLEEDVKEAEFLFRIKPKKANFTLKEIKIKFLTSSSSFSSKVKTVNLDVLLPEGADKKVDRSKVKVVAEIPDDARGETKVKLKAELPEGVYLLQIYPETINVSL